MGSACSMSRLMSRMAVIWSVVSSNSKASSNSRWKLPSGEKCKPRGRFSLRVKREKLVSQVFDRFARAGLAGAPNGAAEFVQRRMRAFEYAVTLNQVHPFQRNIEARIVGIPQQHELAAMSTGGDLAKPLELPDAVIHMDHVVAGLQFREIAEEAGSTNLPTGPLNRGL